MSCGSPARRGGLRAGKTIVEFNRRPTAGIHVLHKLMTGVQVGVRSPLTIIRHTERLQLDVVPEDSVLESN